eukprot:SAG31_NODE_116_length_24094_cov_38.884184_15_plen_99_part_00
MFEAVEWLKGYISLQWLSLFADCKRGTFRRFNVHAAPQRPGKVSVEADFLLLRSDHTKSGHCSSRLKDARMGSIESIVFETVQHFIVAECKPEHLHLM